jgi:hypothetical protein
MKLLLLLLLVVSAGATKVVSSREWEELAARRRALLGAEAQPGEWNWKEPGGYIKRYFSSRPVIDPTMPEPRRFGEGPLAFREDEMRRINSLGGARKMLGADRTPDDSFWVAPGERIKRYVSTPATVQPRAVEAERFNRREDVAKAGEPGVRKLMGAGPEFWWTASELPASALRVQSRLHSPATLDEERFAPRREVPEGEAPRRLLATDSGADPASWTAEGGPELTQRVWHQHEARPVYERINNDGVGHDEPYLDPAKGHVSVGV